MRKFIKKNLSFLIIVSIFLRIVLILVSPEIADAKNAHTVADIFLKTGVLYQKEQIYPYPPVWIYYMAFSAFLQNAFNIPFVYLIKIPPFLADVTILFLLMKLLKKKQSVLIYAFNPIVIAVSSVFGKEDPVMILLAFLAYLYFEKKGRIALSSFWLGLSVWLKTFTVVFAPLYLFRLKDNGTKIKFILIIFLPLMLIMFPFLAKDFETINSVYFKYVGSADYGWLASLKALSGFISGSPINFTPINYLLPQLLTISKYAFLFFYVLLLVFLFKHSKKSLLLSIILIFLLFFITYGGIGTNFLFWIIPFIMLYDHNVAKIYTLIGTPSVFFYILGQFYVPVLRHYDFFLFTTPVFINLFYFLSTSIFWFYLVAVFFSLLTQNNSKARFGSR